MSPAVKTPRIAVIGCGYWGKNLVRAFHELGALAAISDFSESAAAAMSEAYKVPALSMAAICEDKGISGVVIAAPAVLHASLATQALEAGKHVYVEKPLALSLTDAQALIHLAQARKLHLMVGHLLQYHPAFEALLGLVRAGELGTIRSISARRLNLGKIRTEENVFWSFAPHDISMILALTGAQPVEVSAVAGSYLDPARADAVSAHLRFADGIDAHIEVNWINPVKEQKLTVIGSKASAIFDDTLPRAQKLQLFRHKAEIVNGVPQVEKAEALAIDVPATEPLLAESQHFLDCISKNETPRTDGQEGIGVLKLLARIDEALAQTKPLQPQDKALPYTVHVSSYVDKGCEIGAGTRIWHFSHILTGTKIGRNCVISQNVMIGPDVTVGDNCKIQNNVSLYKGIILADGVFCGPSCVFTNVLTPRAEVERKDEFKPTPVGRGVTIGANATIVCGHKLGEYCMIAAGAVVTKDVPAYALMAGVPARRIGWVSQSGDRLGQDLTCPRTGQRYHLLDPDTLAPVSEDSTVSHLRKVPRHA